MEGSIVVVDGPHHGPDSPGLLVDLHHTLVEITPASHTATVLDQRQQLSSAAAPTVDNIQQRVDHDSLPVGDPP